MWGDKPKDYITPAELYRIRDRCKIGSKVEVHTYKIPLDDSQSRGPVIRRGVVVGKYTRFATVMLPGGLIDSVLWVDMALSIRGKSK